MDLDDQDLDDLETRVELPAAIRRLLDLGVPKNTAIEACATHPELFLELQIAGDFGMRRELVDSAVALLLSASSSIKVEAELDGAVNTHRFVEERKMLRAGKRQALRKIFPDSGLELWLLFVTVLTILDAEEFLAPLTPCDLVVWFNKSAWSIDEFAHLSLGRKPVDRKALKPPRGPEISEVYDALVVRISEIKRASKIPPAQLTNPGLAISDFSTPDAFIAWAKSLKIAIDPGLSRPSDGLRAALPELQALPALIIACCEGKMDRIPKRGFVEELASHCAPSASDKMIEEHIWKKLPQRLRRRGAPQKGADQIWSDVRKCILLARGNKSQ